MGRGPTVCFPLNEPGEALAPSGCEPGVGWRDAETARSAGLMLKPSPSPVVSLPSEEQGRSAAGAFNVVRCVSETSMDGTYRAGVAEFEGRSVSIWVGRFDPLCRSARSGSSVSAGVVASRSRSGCVVPQGWGVPPNVKHLHGEQRRAVVVHSGSRGRRAVPGRYRTVRGLVPLRLLPCGGVCWARR